MVEQLANKCCGNCLYRKECDNYKHNDWLCLSHKLDKEATIQLSLFEEEENDWLRNGIIW